MVFCGINGNSNFIEDFIDGIFIGMLLSNNFQWYN